MDAIRSSVPVTLPPAVRLARLDWHALELDDQHDVRAYLEHRTTLIEVTIKAQVYLRRHHGA